MEIKKYIKIDIYLNKQTQTNKYKYTEINECKQIDIVRDIDTQTEIQKNAHTHIYIYIYCMPYVIIYYYQLA